MKCDKVRRRALCLRGAGVRKVGVMSFKLVGEVGREGEGAW